MNIKSFAAATLFAATMTAGAASAATFNGNFFDVGGDQPYNSSTVIGLPEVDNITQALEIANGTFVPFEAVVTTFTSGAISYNMTAPHNMPNNLSAFLGANGTAGANTSDFLGTVLDITGRTLLTAGNNVFNVFSDDGFALFINGVEIGRFEGLRAPGSGATSGTMTVTVPTTQTADFRIVYFEGSQTQAALEVKNNGRIVTAAVPVPAAFPLLALGLGALGVAGYRRRKTA